MSKKITISQIKPLAGYVLIEPAESETQTASGIYLPDSEGKKPQHGKILAVGDTTYDDGKEIKCSVSVGDLVYYKQWGGNEIKIEDKEYQLMEFKDVIAVIK